MTTAVKTLDNVFELLSRSTLSLYSIYSLPRSPYEKSQRSATLIKNSWFYTKLRVRSFPPFLPNRRKESGSSSRHTVQIFCDQHPPALHYFIISSRSDWRWNDHAPPLTADRISQGIRTAQQLTLPVRIFKLNFLTRPLMPAVVSELYRHLLLTKKKLW